MFHVVYMINLPVEDCELPTYIGHKQNSISRKMTVHLQNCALKDHLIYNHKNILTRLKIIQNDSCIKKFNSVKRINKKTTIKILLFIMLYVSLRHSQLHQ